MDNMVLGSTSRYRHRNAGGSISDSGQARSFALPTTHEDFLSGSAGSMAYSSSSNSTMAGLMQSQVANNAEDVMLPIYTQSHPFGGNVPPGYWSVFRDRRLQIPGEEASRTLPSHSHGVTIPRSDIVGGRSRLGHSPSLQLGQSSLDVAGNVPMGFMSSANAGPHAFQLAASAGGQHWREYGAMSSSYRPRSYQNQSTDGGFLSASLGNNTLPGTWFNDKRGDVGGPSYQTITPQLDAGSLETGLGGNRTAGYQSHYNNKHNLGVENIYSHGIMLYGGGQAREQTAPYEYDSIVADAIRGGYEFDYWIAHGSPPSPAAYASSFAPPIPSPAAYASSSAPRSPSPAAYAGSFAPPSPSPAAYAGSFAPPSPSPAAYAGSFAPPSLSPAAYAGSFAPPSPSPAAYAGSFAPPSPSPAAYTGSFAPPNSPEPQEQGQSTEEGVPMANYSWLLPGASPRFRSQLSNKQTGDVMVSPYDEAAGAPSFQSNHDQTISDHAVLRDPTEIGLGTWLPVCVGQADGADAGGSSSSALPKPVRVTPIRPSPRAISPPLATGNQDQPIIIDGDDAPLFLFGRPLLPQRSAKNASSSRQLKRRHDQNDFTPFDLQLPRRHPRISEDSGDDMPELLGYKCQICNMDLALKPTGTSIDAVPVHVVLPCGHAYHSSCFDRVHGFVGKNEDPPCVCCSEGGAQRRN